MTNNLDFIRDITASFIQGCIAETTDSARLFRPDGRGRYPAVWTRDLAYMIEYAPELMDRDDILFNLKYIMDHAFPEGWIPDRVTPDGQAHYRITHEGFPDSPVLDNGPFLIIAADAYLNMLGDAEADERFAEWKDVLCRGIDWIPVTDEGIITISDEDLHVGYGFTDTVNKTGLLEKETLLLWRAARLLAGRLRRCGFNPEKYDRLADKIEESFCRTFTDESGMLLAATGKCRQIDVWGSCYMISIGFPVSPAQRERIARWLIGHYDGIVESGQIRHLPAGEYWESTYIEVERDTYQNGAYWAVATGWFSDAIRDFDPALAAKTVSDALEYFRTHGVYECVCGEYRKLESYVASATNVYDVVKRTTPV